MTKAGTNLSLSLRASLPLPSKTTTPDAMETGDVATYSRECTGNHRAGTRTMRPARTPAATLIIDHAITSNSLMKRRQLYLHLPSCCILCTFVPVGKADEFRRAMISENGVLQFLAGWAGWTCNLATCSPALDGWAERARKSPGLADVRLAGHSALSALHTIIIVRRLSKKYLEHI